MSRPQEPHRSFFPFGNPFRMISPKGSQISPRFVAVLNAFEEALSSRLKKLSLRSKDDVPSFSWMKLAIQILCETHNDIKILMTELDLPVSDWDEKWIDVYLDISVKLLDVCNAFTSELSRLNQGNLILQCVSYNLESGTSEQLNRARSSLDGWKLHISSKSSRVENCFTILDSLVQSLNLPKVKNSAKGKVLMRAMYGVKVVTVFFCSVFTSAFSGSAKRLLDLNVADTYGWAQAFTDIQTTVNREMRNTLCNGRYTALKELEGADSCVIKLSTEIQNDIGTTKTEGFKNSVTELGRRTEDLSRCIDELTKEVDGFFHIILVGRDALLSNLRANGTL